MKFYLGVTDNSWYNYLSRINPEDINFWQPGGNSTFRALESGAPFLFKLRYPINAIAGVGFFSSHTFLPTIWHGMFLETETDAIRLPNFKI